MKIKDMALAWITVSDIVQAKKFFAQTLGLQVMADNPEHGWLELSGFEGDFLLGVAQYSPHCEPIKAGHNAVVTMSVDDIVAAKKMLEAKNVKFIGEIIEIPGHVKMALFQDPDGNKFQLVQSLDE